MTRILRKITAVAAIGIASAATQADVMWHGSQNDIALVQYCILHDQDILDQYTAALRDQVVSPRERVLLLGSCLDLFIAAAREQNDTQSVDILVEKRDTMFAHARQQGVIE